MKYPPTARVRAKTDFDRIFQHGQRKALPVLALHCLKTGDEARLGLAISRKVDKRAVGRNRIKRILRDHFRLHRTALSGYDLVFVARPGAAALSASQLRQAFDQLAKRCGAYAALESKGGLPHLSPSPNDGSSTDS